MENLQMVQTENNNLLKFLLNAAFFKGWKDESYNSNLLGNSRQSSLELYITSDCNQKCEYCYLQRHGNELYPPEIRDPQIIINNLDILLKFASKKWTNLKHIDIFSGEIVGTPLFFDVLDKILYYKKRGASYDTVLIPSNFSFILSEEAAEKVQTYIDLFDKNNIRLALSASVDGLLMDESVRPLKGNSIRDESFYDRLFEFCKHNNFCFHPMISAYSIEKWIDNYKWFIKKCEQYGMDVLSRVMTLEVRNDDWTPDKIEEYRKFIEFYCEYHFENYFGGSADSFARSTLGVSENGFGYANFLLLDAVQIPTCSISYQLTVRLGDLAIAPCHRTSYPEFLYGKFIVKNNEIVDIEAHNPVLATKILFSNQRKSHHGCDTCWNINSCIRGCFGAQYEYGEEIFMPLQSVCDLLKTKTKTLVNFYRQKGIIDNIEKIKGSLGEEYLNIYLEKFRELEKAIKQYENS